MSARVHQLQRRALRYQTRGGRFLGWSGSLSAFVAERVPDAWRRGLPVVDACNEWYSGAYLLETMPSSLYILMRHGDDPEEDIVRAVNDTVDNDTVGAIVGAAVGALHGVDALPHRWRTGLLGRTTEADDGRVFEFWRQRGTGSPRRRRGRRDAQVFRTRRTDDEQRRSR